MRPKDVLAWLALAAGLAPMLLFLSGCAIQAQVRGSLFQREAPARTAEDAQNELLADQRLLEALGCSSSNLEAALIALDVPQQTASRRALVAYAAAGRSGRCYQPATESAGGVR